MIILLTLNNGSPESWHFYRTADTLNCLIKIQAIATTHSLPVNFHDIDVNKIESPTDFDTARYILFCACMLLNIELAKISRSCSVVYLQDGIIPPGGTHITAHDDTIPIIWASLECQVPLLNARGRTYPDRVDEIIPGKT